MNKVLSFILLFVLAACSTVDKTTREPIPEADYTLVFMVHGDANYTYHENGERYRADERMIDEAIARGKASTNGEVFIFHQKPEGKRFFVVPKKDRVWYHFRGGELTGKGAYSPKGGGFEAEAEIYKSMASEQGRKMFLYFGHEIPSQASFTYHNSQPKQRFNTRIFTEDITLFEDKFDLVVLSTCNNGNPLMASGLTGKSRYLVASPRDLHLSYMDTRALQELEERPSITTGTLADSLAKDSFKRLSEQLQTLVTVGIYDLDVIDTYIHTWADTYSTYLEKLDQESLFRDNTECNKLDIFTDKSIPVSGTSLYFEAPAFGREAGRSTHSVWGCKN